MDSKKIARASGYLGTKGVRLLTLDGQPCVGIWKDTDGQAMRAALKVMEIPESAIRHLDDDDIPERYKVRLNAPSDADHQ